MSKTGFDLSNGSSGYFAVAIPFFVAGIAFLVAGQPVWVAFLVLGVTFGVIALGQRKRPDAADDGTDEGPPPTD